MGEREREREVVMIMAASVITIHTTIEDRIQIEY